MAVTNIIVYSHLITGKQESWNVFIVKKTIAFILGLVRQFDCQICLTDANYITFITFVLSVSDCRLLYSSYSGRLYLISSALYMNILTEMADDKYRPRYNFCCGQYLREWRSNPIQFAFIISLLFIDGVNLGNYFIHICGRTIDFSCNHFTYANITIYNEIIFKTSVDY